MAELTDTFNNWAQLDSALSIIAIIVLIPMLGIAAYRLTFQKHIDSNGKVTVTRRFSLPVSRFISKHVKTAGKPETRSKPFSPYQKRLLRIVYSLHEALFGLLVFAFGLGLVTKVFFEITVGAQGFFEPVTMTLAALGILAMPVGVLLVYFRNADNPFDEK